MDESLYSLITSFTSITDVVSDRVFPVIRPQGSSLPAITYRKVSSPRVYDDDGRTFIDQHFDLHVYGKTYSEVQSLLEDLENKLSGSTGAFGQKTVDYTEIIEVGNDDYLEDQEIFTDQMEIQVTFKTLVQDSYQFATEVTYVNGSETSGSLSDLQQDSGIYVNNAQDWMLKFPSIEEFDYLEVEYEGGGWDLYLEDPAGSSSFSGILYSFPDSIGSFNKVQIPYATLESSLTLGNDINFDNYCCGEERQFKLYRLVTSG